MPRYAASLIDSHFIHIHGVQQAAKPLTDAVEPLLRKASLALLHTPIALPGADPLPVDQDERLLLCQVADNGVAAEVDRAARSIAGVREVSHQAMACERITPGGPDDADAAATAVSWIVQYNGPAQDPSAFHAYYRTHHVPIVNRMPGIRSLNWYVPTPSERLAGLRYVEHLQLVQAMFDDLDGLLAMRASRERKEGLQDFNNYPAFEGPVTHQAMLSRRITTP
jgi:uncharacterized protein (TIGR02118 family)